MRRGEGGQKGFFLHHSDMEKEEKKSNVFLIIIFYPSRSFTTGTPSYPGIINSISKIFVNEKGFFVFFFLLSSFLEGRRRIISTPEYAHPLSLPLFPPLTS